MSLRSVEADTTSCVSYSRLSGHCLHMRVKHWSRCSFRLDYCNSVLRHLGRTDESVAVGSERRRSISYWYSKFRPHNAGAPSATLVTGTPARRLQGCDVRSSVVVWHFAIVPCRRLPSCRRCSRATTGPTFHSVCAFDWHQDR